MKDTPPIKARHAAGMFALSCLALMLCAYTPQSRAVCVLGPGIEKNVITLDFGPVLVPLNTPASLTNPIAQKRFPIRHEGNRVLDCEFSVSAGAWIGAIYKGTPLGSENIFQTNIRGIGIRIGFRPNDSVGTFRFPLSQPTAAFGYEIADGNNWVIHAELFKIAQTTENGALEAGLYASMYSADNPQKALQVVMTGRGTTIFTPSCTAAATPPVQLGKVRKNLFSSVGSTAAEQSFGIRLNCNKVGPEQTSVYLRMDAKPAASGAPGVIALTPDADAAAGVGIQLLNKDRKPVVYGNSVLVGAYKNGVYTVPFHARYYQTENKVTAGVANGTATFTLEYK